MNKAFESICKMSQFALKKYIEVSLGATHETIISEDGFVYAQGTMPVLLVAHLDTVHKTLPQEIIYDANLDAYYSPQGIGGDDRCGVYMIFEVLKKFNCSVLFCEDEEIGMVGAKKFIQSPVAAGLKFNYIIEFDRTGADDAVFYDCDNQEFEDFITKEFYTTSFGSFSDISTIAPFLKCAAVNLSCGYYQAHTAREYVVMTEMEESIKAACKILERTTDKDVYEYVEYDYSRYYSGTRNSYGYSSKTHNYCIEYIDEDGNEAWDVQYADSVAEAVGLFCMDNPEIPYVNIIMVSKY